MRRDACRFRSSPFDVEDTSKEDDMNTPTTLWIGRALTSLFALFLLGASITPKLLGMPVAEETMSQLGWPAGYSFMIGVIELTCLILYLVPRTSLLGAVLMTGLLGGAMATHIRAESPLFSHVLFSIYLGLFMWGGLWLRDPRLRTFFPIRESTPAESRTIQAHDVITQLPQGSK
jgi:hypothetical protein